MTAATEHTQFTHHGLQRIAIPVIEEGTRIADLGMTLEEWAERHTHWGFTVDVTTAEQLLADTKEDAVGLIRSWAERQPAAVIDMHVEIGDALHDELQRIEAELVGDMSNEEVRDLALLPEVWESCNVAGMGTTLQELARRGVGWVVTQAAYDWLKAHQPTRSG